MITDAGKTFTAPYVFSEARDNERRRKSLEGGTETKETNETISTSIRNIRSLQKRTISMLTTNRPIMINKRLIDESENFHCLLGHTNTKLSQIGEKYRENLAIYFENIHIHKCRINCSHVFLRSRTFHGQV